MTTYTMLPDDDAPCIAGEHYPNEAGTACYYCGLPAERVSPDELARAWADMLRDAPVEGQVSWTD